MSRKTIFVILGLVLVVGALFFFTNSSPAKQEISEDGVIVAFGDSLTYGYGSSKDNDYVSLLSKMIDRPIVNLGVNGDTTADALKRIDSVTKLNPELVIVFLGGNDLLRRVNIETTFSNLDEIVSKIKTNGSKVVLVAVPGSVLGDPYEDRFKELAKKYDATYVPQFLSRLIINRELMSDSIHPNDEGYKIVAEKIFKAVKEYI